MPSKRTMCHFVEFSLFTLVVAAQPVHSLYMQSQCELSAPNIAYHSAPSFMTVNVSSSSDCCAACGEIGRCKSWTFQHGIQKCHLKEETKPVAVHSGGCQSGILKQTNTSQTCPRFNHTSCISDADCDQVYCAVTLLVLM